MYRQGPDGRKHEDEDLSERHFLHSEPRDKFNLQRCRTYSLTEIGGSIEKLQLISREGRYHTCKRN